MAERVEQGARVDHLVGKVIQGRWRLVEKLGEGGMGAVYRAEQLSIRGRVVAVKLLRPEFSSSDEFARRFEREAERAAAVSDPHVVMVLDFGRDETGELFIVMEYVAGDTLSTLIHAGPLPLTRAISFGAQLADALQCVHEAGLIHRDVKPANVIIRKGTDHLKLMDFGIAHTIDDERTHLTQSGVIVGTPAFMAPEQIEGGTISPQTDIYAWGVVMYAMATGRRPFEASSPTAVQYKHVHEPPPPLRGIRADVPVELERIILRALEKRPEDRQPTMSEAAAELRALRISASVETVVVPDRSPGRSDSEAAGGTLPKRPVSMRLPVIAAASALVAAVIFVLLATRSNYGTSAGVAGTRPPAAVSPGASERHTTGETVTRASADTGSSSAVDAAADKGAAAVRESLTLARFFLDRGEYDSAIEELESALQRAPDDEEVRSALESAKTARAAEASVLGGE